MSKEIEDITKEIEGKNANWHDIREAWINFNWSPPKGIKGDAFYTYQERRVGRRLVGGGDAERWEEYYYTVPINYLKIDVLSNPANYGISHEDLKESLVNAINGKLGLDDHTDNSNPLGELLGAIVFFWCCISYDIYWRDYYTLMEKGSSWYSLR